jgi:hypothetical protein
MNQLISFGGTKTISKGRSGTVITTGVGVSRSGDGKIVVLSPVNSLGVASPSARIELPVERVDALVKVLVEVAVSNGDGSAKPDPLTVPANV